MRPTFTPFAFPRWIPVFSRAPIGRKLSLVLLLALAATSPSVQPHNLILFVPDGLRAPIVDATTAPSMAKLSEEGVDFRNSHSLFPTFTTANASAFATGHKLGDTGDFSNYIYSGFRVTASGATVTPFLESDPVLRQVNDYYGGDHLDEVSIVAAAREHGYATALIGKLGPTAIFDLSSLGNGETLIVDDLTGQAGQEVPLSDEWKAAFSKYRLPPRAPSRGDNGNFGSYASQTGFTPGTGVPNLAQQQFFIEATVKVALPHFKEIGKPFVLVFWSRDPDGTQHNQGDSPGALIPGINGPTSLAAIRNADTALGAIRAALDHLNLSANTNVVVAADHGFSTISRTSTHSASLHPSMAYTDVPPNELPLGFLAIDLFAALQPSHPRLKLFDPDDAYRQLDWTQGQHTLRGNAVLGEDPDHPLLIVAANGGSDLIYVPDSPPTWKMAAALPRPTSPFPRLSPSDRPATSAQKKLVASVVNTLLDQDYVSGIFVHQERFGRFPGALSTEAIGVAGGLALTPRPAIVVNFASQLVPDCPFKELILCTAEVADTALMQGQGTHGSFSRADTWNFMAASGPDFRTRFVDPLPASSADIGMTLAHLLNLSLRPNGPLPGRVLKEALGTTTQVDPLPTLTPEILQSSPDPRHHLRTMLQTQVLNGQRYLDAAGFPGRTVGLDLN